MNCKRHCLSTMSEYMCYIVRHTPVPFLPLVHSIPKCCICFNLSAIYSTAFHKCKPGPTCIVFVQCPRTGTLYTRVECSLLAKRFLHPLTTNGVQSCCVIVFLRFTEQVPDISEGKANQDLNCTATFEIDFDFELYLEYNILYNISITITNTNNNLLGYCRYLTL